ncbi:MAG: GNAT family N-acetyltransferase [SAR324 cluster bacterium]|nr:GNAT family N-acetyltransferase [SAR324 cluster bacterium]
MQSEQSKRPIVIMGARTPEQIAAVRGMILAYAESLGVDLGFQNFDLELAALPGVYAAPAGRLLYAEAGGKAAGCVGLKRLSRQVCEMKRLYVMPSIRGLGLGRLLAEALITEARYAGYRHMRLDSLPGMDAAQALYTRLGFREIAPYYDNPVQGAVFMELPLAVD